MNGSDPYDNVAIQYSWWWSVRFWWRTHVWPTLAMKRQYAKREWFAMAYGMGPKRRRRLLEEYERTVARRP